MKILHLEKPCLYELIRLIEDTPAGKIYIFRGQSDAKWDLIPSLYRTNIEFVANDKLNRREKYAFVEKTAIDLFFNEGFPYLPAIERTIVNDRIFAQHFGISTRFLDWSRNPFVALFFALKTWQEKNDAALFMIIPEELFSAHHLGNMKYNGVDIDYPPFETLAIKPPFIDNRIGVQHSIFTYHPYGKDNEDFVPLNKRAIGYKHEEERSFAKIIIPAAFKQALCETLCYWGIDEQTLFPDLNGVGANIAARVKAGRITR